MVPKARVQLRANDRGAHFWNIPFLVILSIGPNTEFASHGDRGHPTISEERCPDEGLRKSGGSAAQHADSGDRIRICRRKATV